MRNSQTKLATIIPVALLALLSTLNSQLSTLFAQGAAFTYQGLLTVNNSPVTGSYDFNFNLFAAGSGGSPVAIGVTNPAVAVNNGLFTTNIDFGAVFTGSRYWLEIGARPAGSPAAFQIMAPRQELTPTPYAIFAESAGTAAGLAASAVSAPQLNTVGGPSPGQVLSFNGTDLVWVTAGGSTSSNAWQLGGNGGTTSANFLGTTDNRPLSLDVSNAPALRLVPTGDSPQVVGGARVNLVAAGMQGATIGGGGSIATYGSPFPNQIFAYHGTIGGGLGNTIRTNAYESTIAGGNQNTIELGAFRASIGGGILNTVTNTFATIGGGEQNTAGGDHATIGGGQGNIAGKLLSTVGGGYLNKALGNGATVGGGDGNSAAGIDSTVAGGKQNQPSGNYSTVSGGGYNAANFDYGTASGGSNNLASGLGCTVSGGLGNTASGRSAMSFTSAPATVGGGQNNNASGNYSTIPGGFGNSADGFGSFAAGQNAHANHDGSFIWGDGTGGAYSGGPNRFDVLATGGVGFYVPGGSVNIAADGTLSCKVLTISGADVAEPFEISTKDLPKGSVVIIDENNPGQLKLSDCAYDKRVAGILSGANGVRAGICLSQQGFNDGGQNVALSGRVYVLADASSGSIKPGDLLTTSSTPGHAMKVTDHSKAQGAIIGKAMSALKDSKGMVLVLVTLQ